MESEESLQVDLSLYRLPNDNLDPTEFGIFLRKLREKTFKLDQHDFGYMLCHTRTSISWLESGKRKPSDEFLDHLLEEVFKLEYPDHCVINRELD